MSWTPARGGEAIVDIENILEIQNLRVDFRTYSGVVKALDGIALTIRKRETFGLVGETGCGKSVTANCILRLIKSPPGRIETGHIFYSVPSGKMEEIKELQRKIKTWEERGERETTNEEMKEAVIRLRKLYSDWDILWKDEEYMQKIRGGHISMIFQEPASALNPVMKIGDQIAEVLLAHKRHQLATTVLKNIDHRLGEHNGNKRSGASSAPGPETARCSDRHLAVPEDEQPYPDHGVSFETRPPRPWERFKLRYARGLYVRTRVNPSSRLLGIMSRIPILNRYELLIREEALRSAEEMLELVRISDPHEVLDSYPFELSGGMQQRVLIAMALACRPRLLIADEPTSALDVSVQAQIMKVMREMQERTDTSILLITHNLGVVAETCHRVGVMYAGVMVETGTVKEIFKKPLHPYTQGLIGSIPKIGAMAHRLDSINGTVPDLIDPPSGCRFNPRCPYAVEICRAQKPLVLEVSPGHTISCHMYGKGSP
jgi:peptide/nickel transport system ATP-binding protein